MLGLSATMERKDGMTKIFKLFLGEVLYSAQREVSTNIVVQMVKYQVYDAEFNETILNFKGQANYSSMIKKICEYNSRTDFILTILQQRIIILKNIKYIRLNASKKSGGTSDFIIKNKIIYHLKKFKTKGKSLLDFGAGKGELINILKKFDFLEVSGVDLFKKPKSLNKDIKWYQFDLNNKFKIKNKFDFVICSETIEHLENPRHILRTIYNILKKKRDFNFNYAK
jgi:2-polyprenyl-3-methyl-5-hydroxy-6-metoxy-1,4-benzoquinol methylase